MQTVYFCIVAGCNKIQPFILCCSTDYKKLEEGIKNKFGELKKYKFSDLPSHDGKRQEIQEIEEIEDIDENEIPYEFDEIPCEALEHVISYTLDTNLNKISKQQISRKCECYAFLGIFKSNDNVVDFDDIISRVSIL